MHFILFIFCNFADILKINKMKNILKVLLGMLLFISISTQINAQSFSVANSDGKLISYRVVGPSIVEVGRAPGDMGYQGVINIPSSVSYNGQNYTVIGIGNGSFANPWPFNVTAVSIPNSVTYIDSMAFLSCNSLTTVTLGNGLINIRRGAFKDCSNLKNIIIPNSVTNLEESAFNNSGLKTITIPANVTKIGNKCFSGCQLDTVNYNAINCSNYGLIVFNENSLKLVKIGDEVISIPSSFMKGIPINKLIIGTNVSTIQDEAFSALGSIVSLAETAPAITSTSFQGVDVNIPVIVPCFCIGSYSMDPLWNVFPNMREACSSISNVYDEDKTFLLYPNPTIGNITLSCDNMKDIKGITIYDLQGKEVLRYKNIKNTRNIEIDISSLKKGIYNIELIKGKNNINKKFIIR